MPSVAKIAKEDLEHLAAAAGNPCNETRFSDIEFGDGFVDGPNAGEKIHRHVAEPKNKKTALDAWRIHSLIVWQSPIFCILHQSAHGQKKLSLLYSAYWSYLKGLGL